MIMHERLGGDLPYEPVPFVHDVPPDMQPAVDIVRTGSSDTVYAAPETSDFATIVAGEHRGAVHYSDSGEARSGELQSENGEQDTDTEAPAAGGGRDVPPPTIPPVAVAEGYSDEPFVVGHLERFADEQPTGDQKARVVELHTDIIRGALTQHADYIDKDTTATDSYLLLEYGDPDHLVQVVIEPATDAGTADSIGTHYHNSVNGHWDRHDYLKGPDGAIIRDDHAYFKEEAAAGDAERDSGHELEPMPEVGPAQMAYVGELVKRAEPPTVPFPRLEAQVVRRLESQTPIEPEDLGRAADEFTRTVRNFVDAGGKAQEGERTQLYSWDYSHMHGRGRGRMFINASSEGDLGASLTVDHISGVSEPLNEKIAAVFQQKGWSVQAYNQWQVFRRLGFRADGERLTLTRVTYVDAGDGTKLEVDTQTAAGDLLEVRLARNFLRKPLAERPPQRREA